MLTPITLITPTTHTLSFGANRDLKGRRQQPPPDDEPKDLPKLRARRATTTTVALDPKAIIQESARELYILLMAEFDALPASSSREPLKYMLRTPGAPKTSLPLTVLKDGAHILLYPKNRPRTPVFSIADDGKVTAHYTPSKKGRNELKELQELGHLHAEVTTELRQLFKDPKES